MNNTIIILGIIAITLFAMSFTTAYSIHSITICGNTYVCGVADGVCPSAFPGVTSSCNPPDPDCNSLSPANPSGGGGAFSVTTPNTVYNCTSNKEIDIFNSIQNNKIFSLDGFCLDLKVLNANVINSNGPGQLVITRYSGETNVSVPVYHAYNITYTVPVNSSVLYFRTPSSWASGIIKNSISLYYQNGTKINTTYLGDKNGYYYYSAKVNSGNGIYVVAGEKKPSIWYVINEIDKYYSGEISFVDVVKVILNYYT